jgi:hypothetical protein
MTQEDALLRSARTVGWTLVLGGSGVQYGVVLIRRAEDRFEVLSYASFTGTAVVIGQQLGGCQLWRHEVAARSALFWATGEFDDDAPLAAQARAHDTVRKPGT